MNTDASTLPFEILKIALLLLCLACPFPAIAKEPIHVVQGMVVKVADGDTITVNSDGNKVKVRLYGIDAPEVQRMNHKTGYVSKLGQPYGDEASRALASKVLRQRVRVEVMDIDRYRRSVCVVWKDGRNVNQEMVAEGWAWAYRQYLDRPHSSEYVSLEEKARRLHRGLWTQGNPMPPWEFRKLQRIQ